MSKVSIIDILSLILAIVSLIFWPVAVASIFISILVILKKMAHPKGKQSIMNPEPVNVRTSCGGHRTLSKALTKLRGLLGL